jgi:hypothetical protein
MAREPELELLPDAQELAAIEVVALQARQTHVGEAGLRLGREDAGRVIQKEVLEACNGIVPVLVRGVRLRQLPVGLVAAPLERVGEDQELEGLDTALPIAEEQPIGSLVADQGQARAHQHVRGCGALGVGGLILLEALDELHGLHAALLLQEEAARGHSRARLGARGQIHAVDVLQVRRGGRAVDGQVQTLVDQPLTPVAHLGREAGDSEDVHQTL